MFDPKEFDDDPTYLMDLRRCVFQLLFIYLVQEYLFQVLLSVQEFLHSLSTQVIIFIDNNIMMIKFPAMCKQSVRILAK